MKAIAREHGMAERQEQEQINNQRLLSAYAMLPQRQKLAKRGIKKNRMAFDSTAFDGTAFEGTAFEGTAFESSDLKKNRAFGRMALNKTALME